MAPDYLPGALRHLAERDRRLATLIELHGAPTLSRTRNAFASLGRAIVYQQLSGSAAGTIYRRFVGLFGGRFPTAPQLAAARFEALRGVGLSAAKARYLQDLAAHVADGRIAPRRFATMTDEQIGLVLTAVKGIGPWSVHMFLMFGLNRPDVLPVGDLGVRKGMMKHFRLRTLPAPARMEALATPWQPYRSVGSWYMWRLLDS
jgi:DNA-3-methyladenine glycosylase II